VKKGISLIGLILLIVVLLGTAVLFYRTRSQGLVEKTFQLDGKPYFLLLPRNHFLKTGDKGALSVGKGDIFSSSVMPFERKAAGDVSCEQLKLKKSFSVFNSNFKKEMEICVESLNVKGIETVLLSSPSFGDQTHRYAVGLGLTKKLYDTQKGKEKAKEIFASFKVQ
jgi:hypothetical protein